MDAQRTERARLLNLVSRPWIRARARAQSIVEYVLMTSSVLVVALAAAALFGQSILTYGCILLAAFLAWMLGATRFGLALRAVGRARRNIVDVVADRRRVE